MHTFPRHCEQQARLLVVGRKNATASGIDASWHNVCVRGLSKSLIGKT
jgi:hypothetical protein